MTFLSRISTFFGRGEEDALSIPAMDGVLKPNKLLDAAEQVTQLKAIDNLVVIGREIYCSSGNALHRVNLEAGTTAVVKTFDAPITAIAAGPKGDQVLVAIENAGLELVASDGASDPVRCPGEYTGCVTAMLIRGDDELIFSVGSRKQPLSEWKRDLMNHGNTGVIASHSISTGKTQLIAEDLAFPYGLAFNDDGSIAATEAWKHQITGFASSQAAKAEKILLPDLPAYPARLVPASGGGYWLALFAPRRQLTEFVLQDDDYRREMMATIPSSDWIGPDFSEGSSLEQPLQSGSVRQMGIMKPWAPSRSYGMVARLDNNMTPLASYHSRADGIMHGIASIVELDGYLYIASRGAGRLLRLSLASEASV